MPDVQPPPVVDQLEVALFGPFPDAPAQKEDEASVFDAWQHWQARIGKTRVQQIKNGHLSLDSVENLMRMHR